MSKRKSDETVFDRMSRKMKYAKAQAVIVSAAMMSTTVCAHADNATKTGSTILSNIIDNVFGPLGKIVGGFMVVGGVFKYLMAQKDEDARGQHGAIMSIAIGALLFGASTILGALNISSLVNG